MNRRDFFITTTLATTAFKNLQAQSGRLTIEQIRQAALTLPPIYERLGNWYAEIRREINWDARPIEIRQFHLKLFPHSEGRYEERDVWTRLNEAKLAETPIVSPFVGKPFNAVTDQPRGKFYNIATIALENLIRIEADLNYAINGSFVPQGIAQQQLLLTEELEIMHNPERGPGRILSF